MSTATITPLRSGRAVCELHDIVKAFDSWELAVAYARRHHATPEVLPFPMPSVDAYRVEVLDVAPALRVLDCAPYASGGDPQ